MDFFRFFLFILLLVFLSCGKDSPFSEDYGGNKRAEQTSNLTELKYVATLAPLSTTVANLNGTSIVTINETDVRTELKMKELFQSLFFGQFVFSSLTCDQVAAQYPVPEIINNSNEFKEFDFTDLATRESLIASLNVADPQNGDSVELGGKSLIVKAYVANSFTPVPEGASLIPIACGQLFKVSN